MNNLNDLPEPCPFCGGCEISFCFYLADGWMECDSCGSRGPSSCLASVDKEKAELEATQEWNKSA